MSNGRSSRGSPYRKSSRHADDSCHAPRRLATCRASQLLQILIEFVQDGKVACLAALRSYKHAAAGAALKVSLALDGAVVLASRFIERDANPGPNARDLRDQTGVAHCASSRISFGEEADAAANNKTWSESADGSYLISMSASGVARMCFCVETSRRSSLYERRAAGASFTPIAVCSIP